MNNHHLFLALEIREKLRSLLYLLFKAGYFISRFQEMIVISIFQGCLGLFAMKIPKLGNYLYFLMFRELLRIK